MIDKISKLKDHVNVSIMKAESKDTMCSLGELVMHCVRTTIPVK